MQHSQALQPALVEPETAHLTLMVTALENEEEFLHAEAAMDTFAGELAADEGWAEPMALSLEGLSHFRHQVQEARCVPAANTQHVSHPGGRAMLVHQGR